MAKNHLAKGASLVIKREIETAVKKDREEYGSVAAELLNCMALIVLHDRFGFDAEKLNEFQQAFESQADCITGDFVTLEDMRILAEDLANEINKYR